MERDISKLNGLKLLCIADTHKRLSVADLQLIEDYRSEVDLILTLGDIPKDTINDINPNYGILGNHDSYNYLDKEKNIHMKIVDYKDLKIGGFEGSSRYKNGNFILYTQDESINLLQNLGYCDVLISHDSCYNSNLDSSKEGLIGIDKYLQEKKPLLHLHGHHHKNKIEIKYGIYSVCLYGLCLVSIENGELFVKDLRENKEIVMEI